LFFASFHNQRIIGNLLKKAMDEKMVALDKNEDWDLVELSTGRNTIRSKWVFKKKLNP
jgi:hypothetical protein